MSYKKDKSNTYYSNSYNLITSHFVETIKQGTPVFFIAHINSHLEMTDIARQNFWSLLGNVCV